MRCSELERSASSPSELAGCCCERLWCSADCASPLGVPPVKAICLAVYPLEKRWRSSNTSPSVMQSRLSYHTYVSPVKVLQTLIEAITAPESAGRKVRPTGARTKSHPWFPPPHAHMHVSTHTHSPLTKGHAGASTAPSLCPSAVASRPTAYADAARTGITQPSNNWLLHTAQISVQAASGPPQVRLTQARRPHGTASKAS